MLTEKRHMMILTYLAQKGSATVAELCDLLDISESTVRRDLSELHRQGVLNKVFGGATVIDGAYHAEDPAAIREKSYTEEKAAIAKKAAELVQDVFMSPRFRVYTNSDVLGVELGAALKNVLALCCGVSDGMGLGDNAKALLMTRGMTETARLGVALGGRKETFAGLSGIGDLIVTCTSMHSRNRRCGILVGQGKSPREAMEEVGAVVEGYYAAFSAHQLAEKAGVEMPICQCAYRVLYEGQPARDVVDSLMNRNKKREADESWI